MACFTLTATQRILLASCIEIGLEGAEHNVENGKADLDHIAALLDELQAAETDIEITVMPFELGGNGPGNASDFYGTTEDYDREHVSHAGGDEY